MAFEISLLRCSQADTYVFKLKFISRVHHLSLSSHMTFLMILLDSVVKDLSNSESHAIYIIRCLRPKLKGEGTLW